MKSPKVSVIIRTKNEEKTISKLLEKLKKQTFKDFEIIVVDNASTDKTIEIAKKYKVDKIINISDSDFTHPYSTNLGIERSHGIFIVLTNGHCVPMSDTWIEDGLKNFDDPKVAGIDGHYLAGEAATPWQKAADKVYKPFIQRRIEGQHVSTTNCIIRRDLWQKYPFDESLEECEDYDWSNEMKSLGYKIAKDPNFNVYHLHPLTLKQDLERKAKWKKLCDIIDKRKRPHGKY